MPASMNDELNAKIKKLKKEYPMVCIKVWTPDDFTKVTAPFDTPDWNSEIHLELARTLDKIMDEDPSFSSQNWLRISKASQLVKERTVKST